MMTDVKEFARVAHEVNRAYCQACGDSSQPAWEDAPDWQKQSAVNGVEFHLANPEASASASHDSWLAEKIREGWIYGPVKLPDEKQHPCCVPFEELPLDQQAKDFIFRGVVHAMAERRGVKDTPSYAAKNNDMVRRRSRRMPEGYLSIAALASFAPVSRSTIYNAVRDGRLPACQWRGKVIISEDAVREFFSITPLPSDKDDSHKIPAESYVITADQVAKLCST